MQKKLGVTVFVSDMKRVESYPDFDKFSHVIQHGLQGFIVKNIEGESRANIVCAYLSVGGHTISANRVVPKI